MAIIHTKTSISPFGRILHSIVTCARSLLMLWRLKILDHHSSKDYCVRHFSLIDPKGNVQVAHSKATEAKLRRWRDDGAPRASGDSGGIEDRYLHAESMHSAEEIHAHPRPRGERERNESEEDRSEGVDGYPKEAIAATFLKIERFNDKLGEIRKKLADRRAGELRLSAGFDPSRHNNNADVAAVVASYTLPQAGFSAASYDPIKLPLLPTAVHPPRATQPIFDDHPLSMDALRARAKSRVHFVEASERLLRAEQDAAIAVHEADRLTEDARIAMVLYSQNERSWTFDERTKRYQHVMQAKKEAEGARLKADDDRILAQCLREQLVDPYGSLRSRSSSGSRGQSRSASNSRSLDPLSQVTEEPVSVWILASPLLTLPFTPREASPGSVLTAEKELSTHVVYYAATSTAATESGVSDAEDRPPSEGWLCCSNHGVSPAPTLTPAKSSLETWLVIGAGSGHLNGKYVFSGTHNNTRKFKNASGVELFRKQLPRTSSLIRGIPDETSCTVGGGLSVEGPTSVHRNNSQRDQLPSTLQALGKHDQDFKSMEKIGAWMGSDEIKQKRRRLRDEEFQQTFAHRDGDHVLTQEENSKRQNVEDVAVSRSEASAELCREWVLFMRCSRRIDQIKTDDPPKHLGLGCLKRHYYISTGEKESMIVWAHEQEAWLEKDVISAIIKREAHVERVSQTCQKCMTKFQENMREETQCLVDRILKELNTIRFLTVKVLEAIESWRSHARRRGFSRYEAGCAGEPRGSTLGWSASITVATGRKLFKGSKAFVSKFKRFCRPEDPHGEQERRLVYLGYFSTRDEAELAYDEFANAEARRLNTTVAHLPRRRSVFRSCGKHFAVESERVGPDYCIECKAKGISSAGTSAEGAATAEDWNPPFFFVPGENYILKLASDLDFLDQLPPLRSRLNKSENGQRHESQRHERLEKFPLLGNVFLLPKTPIEDQKLAFFVSLNGSVQSVPRLRGWSDNQQDGEEEEGILAETLDVERIVEAQQVFLQEMQIYHPELFQHSPSNQVDESQRHGLRTLIKDNPASARRIVQALYWDRCAALRIQQERPPLPFRKPGVWCRPDAGEWASLLVRGKHQQHFLFDTRLANVGKEMQERRKKALKIIRKLLKTPLYFVPSRNTILSVIAEGDHVKGDVVMLEVKSACKFLDKYDLWCVKAVVVQRWYRGVRGRRRTRATRRALILSCLTRRRYMDSVTAVAHQFFTEEILPTTLRSVSRKLQQPAYTRAINIDGELVIVNVHVTHSSTPGVVTRTGRMFKQPARSECCRSCARRFHVTAQYDAKTKGYHVASTVCCCKLNNPTKAARESWIVRAYSPFNSNVYRLVIDNDLIAQLSRCSDGPVDSLRSSSSSCNLLTDCENLAVSVHDATNYSNYIAFLSSRASEDAANWRILSDEATQRRKTAEVELERAREVVVELAKRYEIAIGDARRALDFTSRPFHEAQAWDPLENANDWRLLVQKRHTQKDLALAIDDADHCRFELFQALSSESFLRVQSTKAREAYESYWGPLQERQQEIVNSCAVTLEVTQATASRAMNRLCSTQLVIRDTFLLPTRRALIVAPKKCKDTSAAMARMLMISVPGLQRARNTLRRRACVLSDGSLDSKHRRLKRFIIDVSAWTTDVSTGGGTCRNIWICAYDPLTCQVQRVYLDWELVQLLATTAVARPTTMSDRSRWKLIADKLLSLCMLDRFTGEFTLQKLRFFHRLRLLRPQFLSSRWFQDLKLGRECGDGDEIFRQSATIDGRLCFVVVLENWGDLVLQIYRASSVRTYRLRLAIRQVFALLALKPLALHLWICCVKSNQYVASIITTILKYVAFTVGDDAVVLKHPANSDCRKTSNPVRLAATVQQRRLVVCFRDTIGGDLDVRAYDFTHNRTARLLLERENLRRALHSCDNHVGGSASSRRRNLLLSRNRRELCEWITSRLRFQSLLEHPNVLSSSLSPLVRGVQVRTSFLLFNEWIDSSVRNPLSPVAHADVDRYAAGADALLFQGLAHEQLAFIPDAHVAFGHEKASIETRDFIVNGATVTEMGPSACHLKVDFYLKTHRVFARVRHEMQQEVIARHESEEHQLMEAEEHLAARRDVKERCDTLLRDLNACSNSLSGASRCIAARLASEGPLFEELMKKVAAREAEKANSKKKPITRKKKAHSTVVEQTSAVEKQLAVSRLLACLHTKEDALYALLVRQNCGLTGSLQSLAAQVGTVAVYVSDVARPRVDAFCAKSQGLVDADASLSTLHSLRDECVQMRRDLESHSSRNDEAGSDIDAAEESNEEVAEVATETARCVDVSTAIVFQPSGRVEEASIEELLARADSFAVNRPALVAAMLALFQRQARSTKHHWVVQLRLKRVLSGIIAYDEGAAQASSAIVPWNARASALAQEPVAGIAVFIASAELKILQVDALYQSLTSYDPNELLRKVRPSSGVSKRRSVQRSKQLLPWKQLSVERMQTARRLRQQRAHSGLVLQPLDRDQQRECATIATFALSERHLEWMCGAGGSNRLTATALSVLADLLQLRKSHSGNGSLQWTLVLHDSQRMQHLFSEAHRGQLLPTDVPTSELRVDHIRIDADDWEQPRRLIFSCHELQSRQHYFVDCSLAQLQQLSCGDGSSELSWPRERLSVEKWRALASVAVSRLAFRRRNGVMSLAITLEERNKKPPARGDLISEIETLQLPSLKSVSVVGGQEISVLRADAPHWITCRSFQVQEAIRRCRSRRFLKHQIALRRAAAERHRNDVRDEMERRRLPTEWLRMTQEDWLSQEYRGLLTLDAKELKKLKQAFGRAHQHTLAVGRQAASTSLEHALVGWFKDMEKEMGKKDKDTDSPGRLEEDAARFVATMQRAQWWSDKHEPGECVEVDIADIAEWWRQQHVRNNRKARPGTAKQLQM